MKSIATIGGIACILLFSGMSQVLSAQAPCACCDSTYRQFDFWLGDWMVYANGKKVGQNSIVLAQDSCVLIEHWRSANSGVTGTSLNFYDTEEDRWHQTWVDNKGGHLILAGGLNEEGHMEMSSDTLDDPARGKHIHTIQWSAQEGSVRQFWTVDYLKADTTVVLFDGIYRKKDQ